MSSNVSFPVSSSVSPAELACTKKTEIKDVIKPLIIPVIKHILAAKFNRLTGKKFECVRNWEAKSAKCLIATLDKVVAGKVNNKLLQKRDKIEGKFKKLIPEDGTGKLQGVLPKAFGVDKSLDVCGQFISTTIALLTEVGENGQPQTISRLCAIAGILCSQNEDIKDFAEKTIKGFTKKFFEESLYKILAKKCGNKFAGFVCKFVMILGAKDMVDNFLEGQIIKNPNLSEKSIKEYGTDQEKLVLEAVNYLSKKGKLESNCDEASMLEKILSNNKLSEGVRNQLSELKTTYESSKLAQGLVGVGKDFLPEILEKLRTSNVDKFAVELLNAAVVRKATKTKRLDETENGQQETNEIVEVITRKENIENLATFVCELSSGSSGKVLLDSVNKHISPSLNDGLIEVKEKIPGLMSKVKIQENSCCLEKFILAITGLDQASRFFEEFMILGCDLLMQTPEGVPPQTINRLLLVGGILYTGNENIKAITDEALTEFSKKGFEKILQVISKNPKGNFSESAADFGKMLVAKGLVDRFLKGNLQLTEEYVKQNGDVYEKSVLKICTTLLENEWELKDLLENEDLNNCFKEQLVSLKKLCKNSKLTTFAVGVEKEFVRKILARIKGLKIEDIKKLKENELVPIFCEAVTTCAGRRLEQCTESIINNTKLFINKISNAVTSLGEFLFKSNEAIKSEPAKKVEIAQTNTKVLESSKLEDDFSEYLKNLFDEDKAIEERENEIKERNKMTVSDKAICFTGNAIGMAVVGGLKTMAAVGGGILAVGKAVSWVCGFGGNTSGSEDCVNPEVKGDSTAPEGKPKAVDSNASSGVDSGVETQAPGQGETQEPAVAVASSEPDTQKKVESSDSSEQEVEESGKKDVEIQTTNAETKTQEVEVAESAADVPESTEKAKETQNGNFSWWNPFSWWS